jgi:hypothetical protein
MDNQDKNAPLSSDSQIAPVPLLDAKGVARRRFARAGAGATGVILTLQSQPAMATYRTCVAPSGFTSATTSLTPTRACTNNEDPSYWESYPRKWSSRAFVEHTELFGSYFKYGGGYQSLAELSLYDVLCRKSEKVIAADPSGISRLCVAAWLNARMNQQSAAVLTPERVVDIWKQYAEKGEFAPEPKATPWQGSYIFSYLRTTFRTHGY